MEYVSGSRRWIVSQAAQQLLQSFDALSDTEKHEIAVELLRRSIAPTGGDVPDQALVEAADALFRELDAREAQDAHA
jgi:hypothetical protein